MTNEITMLSNQIVLLERHIVNLETNNLALNNSIMKSIAHNELVTKLDATIMFSSFLVGLLTLVATVVVGISIYKLFNIRNEEVKVKKEIIENIQMAFEEKFENLSSEIIGTLNSMNTNADDMNKSGSACIVSNANNNLSKREKKTPIKKLPDGKED